MNASALTPYQNLTQLFQNLSHLSHLQSIGSWDEAVMMPVGGGAARASALATLNTLSHQLLTKTEVGEWLKMAEDDSSLGAWQQANLSWMKKAYQNAICLPTALVKRLTESAMRCEQAWRVYRAENNWKDFAPLLDKNIQLVKESANIRANVFEKEAYDVLLDDFSPGFTQQIINPIFDELKSKLPSLLDKVMKKQSTPIMPEGPFAIDQQKQLGLTMMKAIGFDFNHGRLDVSHHPFCGGVPQDVRITTRYDEADLLQSLMGVCHETGHACYEQQLPEQWLDQPVGKALGMSVHESQSLLIEMQVCRSQSFMPFLSQCLISVFGEQAAFSSDNLYALNRFVQPGLIRVDADEVTYPLHVILRYEIERELIVGRIQTRDLPELWDTKMQAYLGLSTKGDDKNGVMQDVHWPSGAFGYFPAYTLGRLIAAQLYQTMLAEYPKIPFEVSEGDFRTIMRWLKTHVHGRASSVDTQQLLKDATGHELSTRAFLEHVSNF